VCALCERVFLLHEGRLVASGAPDEVLRYYHDRYQQGGVEDYRIRTPGLRWCGIRNRRFLEGLRSDHDLVFELAFRSGAVALDNVHFDIAVVNERDEVALHCRSKFVRDPISLPANTSFVVSYALRAPHLAPGRYRLVVYAASPAQELCWVEQIDACRISPASPFLQGVVLDGVKGAMVPPFSVSLMNEREP
jgi:hypothetical protein